MSNRPRRSTLATAFNPRRNSFGFLRITMALAVFVQHGLIAGGFVGAPRASSRFDLAAIAVDCFFAISGFLVTRSRLSIRWTARFLWHRFLRILPGFWLCLVVVAMVIAPLGWQHQHGTLSGYFGARPHGPFAYVLTNSTLLMHFYDIAGTPRGVPITALPNGPVAWDGSLWSLFWEALCYLGLAALGAGGRLRRRTRLLTVLTGLLSGLWVLRWLCPGSLPTLLDSDLAGAAVRLGSMFLAGALLCVYADRVPYNRRLGPVAIVAATAAILLLPDAHAPASLPIAYSCVWLAIRLPLHRIGARNDLSYGTYIYSAPVQQLLAVYGLHRAGIVPYFAVSLAGTVMLAAVSWRLLEQPALRRKNQVVPGLARLRFVLRRTGGRRAAARPRVVPAAVPRQRDVPHAQSPHARLDGARDGGVVVGEQQQSEQDHQEQAGPVRREHRQADRPEQAQHGDRRGEPPLLR
ncbi:acyltransferase [Frankia sp. AgB32]|uniref:acyltransferase family protein n=1 Tax=Frankia sp. AgB32 TaxID=631119 RepID=UPI00200BA4BD|nr:acyltransferase [Frankia sp. AgB32]